MICTHFAAIADSTNRFATKTPMLLAHEAIIHAFPLTGDISCRQWLKWRTAFAAQALGTWGAIDRHVNSSPKIAKLERHGTA
jgi:hypothetical protein